MNEELLDYAENIGAYDPTAEVAASHFYYDGQRYFLDTGKEYVPLDQRSVVRHLKATGHFNQDSLELALNDIQRNRYVKYAGPLAGHDRGMHQSSGDRLLVTCSPKIIESCAGKWSRLEQVIDGLLGRDEQTGDQQILVFLGWLKMAREALLSGRRRPGQALVLAGPRNCGKSLLIDIIELALGGRRANPYPHFSGKTQFNGDLAEAELLVVDDEAGSTDIRARRSLAASIKSYLFGGAVRIEGKHRNGFTCRPVWRMVIACNDEPEALLVLPPITEDVADKITILRCHRRDLPMPAYTTEERDAFFKTLVDEIPAMLAFLENMQIPQALREERCGVKHFHHPEIIRSLGELSPENALLALVDSLADSRLLVMPWQGTASDLKSALITSPSTSREADRLLSWTAATGTYLGRLIGDRVEKLPLRDGVQMWCIKKRRK